MGFSILPKATSTCGLEEPGIKPLYLLSHRCSVHVIRTKDGQTPNDKIYCCKECDFPHNDINDGAKCEVDVFLSSKIHGHITQA